MIEGFCVFILTHGRPDNVITYRTLEKCGYTGPVFIIIDNEDKTADKYRENFGDKVIMFDKAAIAKTFDEGDNFGDRRAIIYARNACFDIARGLGFQYFMQLDDDYTSFIYKFVDDGALRELPILNVDEVLSTLLSFYQSVQADSISLAQNGDFVAAGRDPGEFSRSLRRRKCMNSFICNTDRPLEFVGRINEDVNTYTSVQARGATFLTMSQVSLIQKTTQSNDGGMSSLYLDSGTYIKSFYTVMYAPSSVHVAPMGQSHFRLHHRISWKHAVPQIIEEKYRRV